MGGLAMDFASFAHHPPKFHHWDGQWTEGGFSTYHLQAIYDFCRTRGPEAPVILGTGAGNSTVCFLHLNPARMISIAPEQPLFDRIMDYCADNAINTRPLESYVEGSEWALPRLASAQDHPQLDFALIDGCHSFPMVMVDFFYINTMMKKGGYLLVDDIELHSVAELSRLLSYQTADFRVAAHLGKLMVFEKLTDVPSLGWWGMQPYVAVLSGDRIRRALDQVIRGMIALREMKRKVIRP
jgi:predicted O-methyltransferase YrrM